MHSFKISLLIAAFLLLVSLRNVAIVLILIVILAKIRKNYLYLC